jgi:hypothetical protein
MRDDACIAIGSRRGAGIHAKRAAGTATVLQHHGLVPVALKGCPIGSGDQVCRAAWREGDDDADCSIGKLSLS